ncbi:DUF1998 domain-containing protein [Agromyces sp. Leaf222]|uniref:DUF1998 domain-containing protein n=1 Tax=Agromyces sp. Leaf222 TaxID=1735688 RepID=UPI0007013984|nr:DUF1998 domain-containing protein [Agromyces sp. Leaf222]KQM81284.1 hypothetical protein ASE68_15970 [Agromyces sp. Leaf222]
MAAQKPVIRSIRLSETVSPFGPGALVDILGESFMAVTGDEWPPTSIRTAVPCDRLAEKLGVDEFWAAPSSGTPDAPKTPGLEFARFPAWLFCQECRRMTQWRRSLEKGAAPTCPECEGRMVPMRFVVVCTTKSHADDVPWVEWVHRPSEGGCRIRDRLRFKSAKGAGEGLSSLEVSCEACKSSRSLGDLRGDILSREGLLCRGRQPWQFEGSGCGGKVEVLQRGATSLHFGDSVSAIDIPEVEGRAAELEEQIRNHPYYGALKTNPSGPLLDLLVGELSTALGVSPDAVRAAVASLSGVAPPLAQAKSSLLAEEYEAFVAAAKGAAPAQDFVTRTSAIATGAGNVADLIGSLLPEVVIVDRLREVRASTGFRRYTPEADPVPSVPPKPYEKKWFPAVEGYGEGIFIRFDGAHVDGWAADAYVNARTAQIATHQEGSVLGSRLHEASAQYMLLHSFAHALMRELAFRSGYSAPSLRERIYCEAAGDYAVFIYTTSTDVEGTLGGLARQGEQPYLAQAIVRALEQVAWCANDPVCSETEAQSIDGLNLAACHACMLAPETSCESFNLLLDRALLVGTDRAPGYFSSIIAAVTEAMIEQG